MVWLLYSFPGLVNYILGGMLFIVDHRFSAADAPGWVVGASQAMWAGTYLLTSLALLKIMSAKNAARLIFIGGLLLAASSLGFIVFDELYTQFVWIFLSGVGSAVYCTPYQVFIRSIGAGSRAGIMAATANYTASWSFGYAVGPFLFGLLTQKCAFSLNLAVSLVMAAGILLIARRFRRNPAAEPAAEAEPTAAQNPASLAETGDGGLIWCSWIVGLVGVLAFMVVRCLVPYRGEQLGISKQNAGLAITVVVLFIGITSLILRHFPRFAYRKTVLAAMSLLGAGMLAVFGFAASTAAFLLAAAGFGIYAGYFYSLYVYHAMAHPRRSSQCLGINEMLVGLAGTVGPLAAGILTTQKTSWPAFAGAAAAVLLAALAGAWIMVRHRRRNHLS